MNDKELLMMAAKAAGVLDRGEWFETDNGECFVVGSDPFDPLNDDGDALRLAVKLQFDVIPKWGDNCVCIIGGGDHFEEPQQPDVYAAMRRAIVRAAAEIGSKL